MLSDSRKKIVIDGQLHFIQAKTYQEFADKIIALHDKNREKERLSQKHRFSDVAENWFSTYAAPNIAEATEKNYRRQLDKYLLPSFGKQFIEDVSTEDIQHFFNTLPQEMAKSTKIKIKNVLNLVFECAMEDGLILKNPLTSSRLKIQGNRSVTREVYTVEQMHFLYDNMGKIQNQSDRIYLMVMMFHPLRGEEMYGLRWGDVDFQKNTIRIERAVTHPSRNQPQIKPPKTESSYRTLGMVEQAVEILQTMEQKKGEFVLGGAKPLTQQQIDKMYRRIERQTGFDDKICSSRFRTTVLTDLYDVTKDEKYTQDSAGHANPRMTMERYAKGRLKISGNNNPLGNLYAEKLT